MILESVSIVFGWPAARNSMLMSLIMCSLMPGERLNLGPLDRRLIGDQIRFVCGEVV